MKWRRPDAAVRRLIEDCEQFLAGSYAEHVAVTGGRVPVWAWVNLLAHGTETDLRAAAAPRPPAEPITDWERARGFLAGEVLAATDGSGGVSGLGGVQQSALVPLELDLAADPSVERWRPGQMVAAVLAALPDRSRPRRP